MKKLITMLVVISSIIIPISVYSVEKNVVNSSQFPLVFLFIVILLFAARVGASFVQRFRQPSVLGELLIGVVIAAIAFMPGLHGIHNLSHNPLVVGIAEIGVLLLLFRTGIETNLDDMKRIGVKALIVAIAGVILPFAGGYFASKILMPDIGTNACLFIGATLTATSVGISVRVFKDLNILKSIEAQIVLGAAVIDDILGLLILAIVGGIVSVGYIETSTIIILCIKSFVFFVGAIFLGRFIAPYLGAWTARIHTGIKMKMALALLFCGVFSYAASSLAGLAPIIGSFAAGLVLNPVHFKKFDSPFLANRLRTWIRQLRRTSNGSVDTICEMEERACNKEKKHVDTIIESINNFFVPIFFVYTGMQVNLAAFSDVKTIGIALIITLVAIVGKVASGYAAGNKVNNKIIGFGMVPRGEVGLIFLNIGKSIGIVNSQIFTIGVIMVILTTLFTPPILNAIINKQKVVKTLA